MENDALPEFERANVGDYVEFGRYPQTAEGDVRPVEWRVLARENNKALVISRYGLDARRFDESANNWDSSEIRRWLNGEFYNSTFSIDEKACIESFNEDNVFLLSKEEAEKYFANNNARKCNLTSYAKAKGAWEYMGGCCWWLRSPGPNFSNNVYDVNRVGDVICICVYDCSGSVRPALWINLESGEIKVSEACKNANVGDYVEFGCYPQTAEGEVRPVEWQVLARENNSVLVISRYGLDAKRFGSSNNWKKSEIRKWLNGEFYTGFFTAEEKARIKSFNQDNVFLLSREEAEKYFADDDARKCKPTAYAKSKGVYVYKDCYDCYCYWFLRSPISFYDCYCSWVYEAYWPIFYKLMFMIFLWPISCLWLYFSDDRNSVYYVSPDGGVYSNVCNNGGSVRPALWINLES